MIQESGCHLYIDKVVGLRVTKFITSKKRPRASSGPSWILGGIVVRHSRD